MRDDGEFVAFVERSGSRLCETAFLLCRDWNFAQDLTQITFIKVYLSWGRIRHDDPYRYSKKVLLRAYLDHKRLKSSAELRTDAVPDRPAAADAAELRRRCWTLSGSSARGTAPSSSCAIGRITASRRCRNCWTCRREW